MTPLLKTLSIALLIYFTLRFLIKLLMPYILRFVAKKAEKKMQQMFNGFKDASETVKKESKVAQKSSKTVGEYIDFEEIE